MLNTCFISMGVLASSTVQLPSGCLTLRSMCLYSGMYSETGSSMRKAPRSNSIMPQREETALVMEWMRKRVSGVRGTVRAMSRQPR